MLLLRWEIILFDHLYMMGNLPQNVRFLISDLPASGIIIDRTHQNADSLNARVFSWLINLGWIFVCEHRKDRGDGGCG